MPSSPRASPAAVVHCDIKSSNILLTASGSAKLTDVGLSRLQTKTFLSDLDHIVGTFACAYGTCALDACVCMSFSGTSAWMHILQQSALSVTGDCARLLACNSAILSCHYDAKLIS